MLQVATEGPNSLPKWKIVNRNQTCDKVREVDFYFCKTAFGPNIIVCSIFANVSSSIGTLRNWMLSTKLFSHYQALETVNYVFKSKAKWFLFIAEIFKNLKKFVDLGCYYYTNTVCQCKFYHILYILASTLQLYYSSPFIIHWRLLKDGT